MTEFHKPFWLISIHMIEVTHEKTMRIPADKITKEISVLLRVDCTDRQDLILRRPTYLFVSLNVHLQIAISRQFRKADQALK